MIDLTSRYANVGTKTLKRADGTEVRYLERRFLPDGRRQPLLIEVAVEQGDRLDLIANRTLGEPLQWWRIADANNATDPLDLVDETGRKLRVAAPQADLMS